MNYTIKSLRRAGYKVRCIHRRVYRIMDIENPELEVQDKQLSNFERANLHPAFLFCSGPKAKGGSTVLEILDPNTHTEYVTSSTCHKNDSYCKKTGVRVAFENLQKRMEFMNIVCPEVFEDRLLK